MMLEQLITAYLDGELTPEQDRELRDLVRNDVAAREAFESSVLIHITMRWEDRTEVPKDLRAPIFDAVEAMAHDAPKIKAPANNGGKRAAGSKRSSITPKALRSALTVMAAFLVLWLPVSESYLTDSDPSRFSLIVPEAVPTSSAITNSATQQVVTAVDLPSTEQHQPTQELMATLRDDRTAVVDDRPAGMQVPTVGSFFSYSDSPLADAAVKETYVDHAKPSPPDRAEEDEFMVESTPIMVATSYAAGLSSSVEGASDVRQIAASIGYGFSDVDAFGLEIGSTSYTLNSTSSMTVSPGNAASTAADPSGDRGVSGKLSSPEPVSGTYQTYDFTTTRQETSFWGSAFYERKLMRISTISVTGRAGAGVAEYGLLGYGRLVGEWTISGGLSVVVGAEARAMPFRVGSIDGQSTSTSYGTILTALTGLYLRF